MKSGEILSYERQVEYVLQDKFKYKGKTILPIKYRSDFNVIWSDGTLQVFDVKGNPDSMSLLKRKMIWAKYPETNLTFICRNLKYGGWVEYDTLKKLRREAKKMYSEEIDSLLSSHNYMIDSHMYNHICDTSPQISYIKYDAFSQKTTIVTNDGYSWIFIVIR